MDLIDQLKDEHKRILNSLSTVGSLIKDKGQTNITLLDSLKELTDILMPHLDLEDKLLYPAFEKSKVEELKRLGATFSKEMQGITKVAVAFINKYQNIPIEKLRKDKVFLKTLNVIVNKVNQRVLIEEDILFPVYEKYFK